MKQLLLVRGNSPIRARLARDLVLLLVLIGGLLAGASALLMDRLRGDLAEERIGTAAAQVRDEVRALLRPVEQQLLIARDALDVADLNPADEKELNERLIPVLTHIPQISGAIDSRTDGAEYYLREDGDGWLTRLRGPGTAKDQRFTRWDAQAEPLSQETRQSDYDPRTRPWFRDALHMPNRVAWTAPYVFQSLGTPGITAAIAWNAAEPWTDAGARPAANTGPGGTGTTQTPDRVTALDVTLGSVVQSIDRLDLGTRGRAFLFSGNGGVFAPPGKDEDPAESPGSPASGAFFSAESRLGGSVPFEAVAAWKAAGQPTDGTLRFESGGGTWWAGFRPLTDDPDAAWVGVALPAPDALGELGGHWYLLALTAVAILGAGVGLALLLVRKYSRQLRDLPRLSIDRAQPEADLRELIADGEGAHLELKSTMRMNLHTRSNGKEIELAWLKGVTAFLDTEGGILLLGVADDGRVLGLAEDRFENDDRCRLHFKNLLSQHLGPEYARFVRFEIHELDGQRVGAVECERADAPAFLRYDGKGEKVEAFVIRNGPSNVELSVSRALRYIRGRF